MGKPTALSHQVPYPGFGVHWVRPDKILLIGGGGSAKTGIPNGIREYKLRGLGIGNQLELYKENRLDELPYRMAVLPSVGLLALSAGKRLDILRLGDLKLLATVLTMDTPAEEDSHIASAFSADGSLLAAAADDGLVRLYRLEVLKVGNPELEVDPAREVEPKPKMDQPSEGETGSGVDEGPQVSVRVDTKGMKVSKVALTKPINSVGVHPLGRHVVGSVDDGTWRVWTVKDDGLEEDDEPLPAYKDPAAPAGVIAVSRCARFSLDGRWLYTVHHLKRAPRGHHNRSYLTKWGVVVGTDGRMRIEPDRCVPVSSFPSMCLALNDAESLGAVADTSGRIITFTTTTLSQTVYPNMHGMPVTDVAFGPSGPRGENVIASCSGDSTLRVLRIIKPAPVLLSSLWFVLEVLLAILISVLAVSFVNVHQRRPHHDWVDLSFDVLGEALSLWGVLDDGIKPQ